MRFSTMTFAAVSCTLVLAVSACGQDTAPPPVRNLDRPSEIGFACFGDLRVGETVITSGQPLSSCIAHQNDAPPEGQEDLVSPDLFGFVLQPTRGTVAVVNIRALGVQDNDPLTPGLNDIPVGSLPVGMAEDRSGCHMLTANSGSCDLAAIDVTTALDRTRITQVRRVNITAPNGERLLAKPRAIATTPQTEEVGAVCPTAADGVVYVAYPDCQLVAAVEADTGAVRAGLVFREDGSVDLASDADYAACPAQCGDAVTSVAHGVEPETFEERPVVMEVSPDGSELFVASESSPFLTIVELDVNSMPTRAVRRIRVEGDVGLTNFAISDRIEMGGDEREGGLELPDGEFQFVYAIATDSTVRVIDLDKGVECDTQVDPRFLKSETDVSFLSCMPVGDPRTPPRRFGAVGPGIQLPGRLRQGRSGLQSRAVPLDIAFSTSPSLESKAAVASPDTMVGTFAFVTSATGLVFVVNVDDDNYADTKRPDDPIAVFLPLALPHQLRDNVPNRDALASGCATPSASRTELGPRLMSAPEQVVDIAQISLNKLHELPFFRGLACEGEDTVGNLVEAIVTELSFVADAETRETSFPDLRVVENQEWSIAWEGSLSADNIFVDIDGPPVRKGVVTSSGDSTILRDENSPFCDMGLQPFDIVSMLGCDPLVSNADCGVGEECFVHPESSSAIQSGVCVPAERVDEISGACRDFFTSRRRYSVMKSSKDELELAERRRVLRTSPLDGCDSAEQCETLADRESLLALDAHPIEAELPEPEQDFSWVCEADPSRAPGVDRCVMSCEASADCEDGFICSGQRCVEAPIPPQQCLLAVQRYQGFVGEAFSVIGSDDGFLHSISADPASGQCVAGADAHPLAVARIPLRPAPCDEDDDFTTGPNPCSTTIQHTEEYFPFAVEGQTCVPQDVQTRVREAAAVRFSNPALTFHLVDSETQGDLACRNDQAGDGPAFGTAFSGYQMIMDVGGGFLPKSVPNLEAALPIRIAPGPSGNLWILDQGDASSITQGRLFRINPRAPAGFELTTLL